MRKIIVYIAASADGYIARPDGDVEWLSHYEDKGEDYGMGAFYKSIDTVLMGRKTYEIALKFGQTSYKGKKNYIFSHTPRRSSAKNVEFVSGQVGEFARRLRASKGKNIWLVGGGELIDAFLQQDQIDEFIIHTIPIFLGEGIPLIPRRRESVPLRLLRSRTYPSGIVQIHYGVGSTSEQTRRKHGRKIARQKRR